MDGPRGYYVNKLDTERQIPCDFTHMWSLKNKTNEQTKFNRSKLIDTEDKLVVVRGEDIEGTGQKGEEDYEMQTSRSKISPRDVMYVVENIIDTIMTAWRQMVPRLSMVTTL